MTQGGTVNAYIGKFMTISPEHELQFFKDGTGRDIYDIITLQNTLSHSIAYKVKTTSLEKFKVRPSTGILRSEASVDIYVYLQPGYENSVHRDQFLIMAMELTEDCTEPVKELWKTAKKEMLEYHRLRCSFKEISISDEDIGLDSPGLPVIDQVTTKMDQLVQCNVEMQQAANLAPLSMMFLIITVILWFTMWIVVDSYFPDLRVRTLRQQPCVWGCLFR